MGWEPRGSAASTGIHQFCPVWRGQDQNTPQGWHRMLGQGDEQGGGFGKRGGEGERQGKKRRERERKKDGAGGRERWEDLGE